MKSLIASVFGLLFGASCFAVDAVWNRQSDNASSFLWCTPANWLVDGAVPSEPPTNAADNVVFPHVTVKHAQQVLTGNGYTTASSRSWTVNSVTGDTSVVIMNGGYAWNNGNVNSRLPVTVLDPNGFFGFWCACDSAQVYVFPTSESFMPEIHNLDASGRITANFAGVGTAEVDALFNPGALTKWGDAQMRLKGTIGADTHIYVATGGITFAGHAAADTVERVTADAYLHLDASVSSSLQFADGSTTSVTNWYDVRGNGRFAGVPDGQTWVGVNRMPHLNLPFVSTETSPTGLRYLDFGSCHVDGKEPLYGPTNCCMQFDRITNGAEIFYVVKYHEKISVNAVLGDSDYAPLQPSGGAIFGGSANDGLANGHIYLNGTRVSSNYTPADGFTNGTYVLSFGPSSNAVVQTIAVDQCYSTRCGGMMIGEILIFTNALSGVDRLRVHNHLKRKWITGGDEARIADAGAVLLQNADVSVGVDAGKTAVVLDLVAENGTVVKTGGGTLRVDTVFPTNATFDVRGGSVSLERVVAEPATTSPASNPLVRLDASADGTVVTAYNGTYATDFVTAWRDCRIGTDIAAVPFSNQSEPNRPMVRAAQSPTGLPVVDFGMSATSVSSLTLPWYGESRVRSGFAVVRQISGSYSFVPFFGCKDMCMERECIIGGQHARLLHPTYPHPAASAALWTVNGRPVDPTVYMPAYFSSTSPFVVVAFVAHEPLGVGALALGRDQATRAGGVQIGEFILYDRELNDRERRDTEAYLMKKWLGSAHPSASAVTPTYAFAAGVDPVFDTSTDATVDATSVGTGSVVKRGTGKVTLLEPVTDGSGFKSVSVESGSLALTVPAESGPIAFHFDVSEDSSLTKVVDGSTTYVPVLNDVRGNGIAATVTRLAHSSGNYYNGGTGTLVLVTFPSGASKPGLDCGSFGSGTTGSGYVMSEAFPDVREAISIYQNQKANWQCLIFSSLTYADYYRANDGLLFSDSAAACVRNATIWADGVETNNAIVLKDNLPHLVDVLPTAPTHIDTLSFDRGIFGGGQVVFEQIGFTEALSSSRRQYWNDYLRWKWFGVGSKPVWIDLPLGSVSVAADASLDFGTSASVGAAALSGAGSVTVGALANVARIGVDGADVAAGDHLVVNGKVLFADAVTVAIVGEGKEFKDPGDYVILEATGGLENVELASWTLDTGALAENLAYSFLRDGNRLVLRVAAKGLLIIFR